jgi:CRP-like cAMP-binding protein
MLDTLFARLERRDHLSDRERAALHEAAGERRSFAARATIVPQGVRQTVSNLLVGGYVARYKDLPGGQRQILQIHLPGDFIDLPSFLLKELEHDLVALTAVRIVTFPHDRLMRITEQHPHLARQLWLGTLIEAAIYREQILSVGRRTALARVAHMFCELYVRHRVVGLARDHTIDMPLTQLDIGDATGMTAVHVNRMLRRLRDDRLIELAARRLRILDWEGLAETAAFDPAYLYLDREPR